MKTNFYIIICLFVCGCAQIVPPSGGQKDIECPVILEIKEEKKNSLNTFYFIFDEYIMLNNWEESFYISPPLNKKVLKEIKGKELIVHLQDTLSNNITYYMSLSNCIKDITEGNILDSIGIIFGKKDNLDSLTLKGRLRESYSLKPIDNSWVLLFEKQRGDSVVFNETPNYTTKTNKEGYFSFPNIKKQAYQIVALTGYDFLYNPDDKIAFFQEYVIPEESVIINLYAFNPNEEDSIIDVNQPLKEDTVKKVSAENSNIIINTKKEMFLIFQLLQNEKPVYTISCDSGTCILKNISSGEYTLKCILDSNQDGQWTVGSWNKKIHPEKTMNYPEKITVRDKWDLEIDWDLD